MLFFFFFFLLLETHAQDPQVQIIGPSLSAQPSQRSPVYVSTAAAPAQLWPTISITWAGTGAAPSLDSAVLDIVSGCQPSDALGFTVPPPALFSASACRLTVTTAALATAYSSLLATATFQSTTTNVAPQALARTIRLRLLQGGAVAATAFATVLVQPLNAAPSSARAAPALALAEGALPDFAVVIRAPGSCASAATVHGLPAVCLEDPNPPFYRRTGGRDAYAGSLSPPLAVEPASTYNVSFSLPLTSPSYSCSLSTLIVPVGPALWDCSGAAKSDAAAAGEACYFQRFRLAIAGAGATGALSCPSCPFDYESLHCSSAAPSLSLAPLSVSVRLTVRDTLWDAVQPPPLQLTSLNLSLHIADAPEATAIIPPDPRLLQLLAAPAPASPLQPLELDDRSGQATLRATYFILCCQDNVTLWQQLRFHPQALEGAAALPPGSSASAFFAAAPLGAPLRLNQTSAAACFAALDALPPSRPSATSTTNPAARLSLVYAQAFSLRAAAPNTLANLPARSLTLRLWAAPGAQSDGVYFQQRVLLSRANAPVTWGTSGGIITSTSAAALALSAAAGGAPGTALAYLNVSDADTDQRVTFTLLSASVACAGAPAQPALAGLLALVPLLDAPRAVVDAATGAARELALTRSAALVIGKDALYGCGGAAFNVTLAVRAQDSGDSSASHSLLPLRPPTFAPPLTVTIEVAPVQSTTVRSAVGPAGGLSAGGGDFVDLFGASLGLPDGNATDAGVGFFSSAFLFTPSAPAATFPLLNCSVVAHLVQVRCVTSAGWSPSPSLPLTLSATVMGQVQSWPTLLYYAPLVPLAVGNSSSNSNSSAGDPGLASYLALLQASPSATAATVSALSNAAALQQLPSPALGWYVAQPSALAALQQPFFQGTFPLLVGNAPPCSALALASSCVALSAILSSETAGVLPLGRCAQRCPAASAAAAAAAAAAPAPASFLGNAFSSTALASAAIFDCPLPQISGGAWLAVGISFEVQQPQGARACELFAEPPVLYTAGTLTDAAYAAALQALNAPSAGAFAGAAALPSITGVTRVGGSGSPSGTRFTLSGRNLGTGPQAGDAVEYFVAPPCPPTGVVSCAVLRGRGCVYTPAGIECDLDPGGWGTGFSVRVTVGGRTSAAFLDAGGALAYPQPSALTVRLGVPLGSLQQPASASSLLAPSGGSLVSVSGPGLWPPSALHITLGGLPVLPINLRDLAAQEASWGASAASCASLAAAQRQSPPLPGAFVACFGDPLLPFPQPLSQLSPPALIFTAPPGFGTVALTVCLGPSASHCGAANVEYAPPLFSGIALLSQVDTAPKQYKLALSSTALPPCVLSLPTQSGSALVNMSAAQFVTGSTKQSPFAAANRAPPGSGTGEGPLPRPLTSTLSLEACALPSSFWTRTTSDASGAWRRNVTSLPSAALALATRTRTLSTSTSSLKLSAVIYSPAAAADTLELYTEEESGDFTLTTSASASTSVSTQIAYDINRLSSPALTIASVDLIKWRAAGGQSVTVTISNANMFGAVLLYPEGAYRTGNTTSAQQCAPAALRDAPWPAGQHIICPMRPETSITMFDQQGEGTTKIASAWRGAESVPSTPAGGFVYLAPDFTSWRVSTVPLPCYIDKWEGVEGFTRSGLKATFSTPAWAGSMAMVVTSNIGRPTAPYIVDYIAPAVSELLPASGPTNGSVITIKGTNFGPKATLGALWNAYARFLWGAAVDPQAGASYVFFSYATVEPYLRLCSILSWSDSAITCVTPEGVSGSPNKVNVVLSVPTSAATTNFTSCSNPPSAWRRVASQPSAQSQFTFSPLTLFSSPEPFLRLFNNRLLVTLYGASLSRFNLPPPSSPTNLAAALSQAGLNASYFTTQQPPDASASLNASLPWTPQAFWRPALLARAVTDAGLVDGKSELALPVADIVQLTHSSVSFYLPAIEGAVELSLRFASATGEFTSSQSTGVTLQAPLPYLTALTSAPAAALGEGVDDADPCASAALAARPGARLPASTAACLAAAVQPATLPLPPPPQPQGPLLSRRL